MMLMMLAIFLYCQVRSLRSQVQTLNDQVASREQSMEDMNDADDEVPEPPPAVPVAARVLPNPILVTPAGHCYHNPGCHTLDGRTKRLRPCRECLG